MKNIAAYNLRLDLDYLSKRNIKIVIALSPIHIEPLEILNEKLENDNFRSVSFNLNDAQLNDHVKYLQLSSTYHDARGILDFIEIYAAGAFYTQVLTKENDTLPYLPTPFSFS